MSTKPDYEAAAKVYAEHRPGVGPVTDRKRVKAIVDAALGGDPVAFAAAALIAEGGEIAETQVMREGTYERRVIPVDWSKPGRYLVFPLPVESAEAKETPK